jgi:hypothetical protein
MRKHLLATVLTGVSFFGSCGCFADEPESDPTLAHDQTKAVGEAVKQDAKAVADAARDGAKQVASAAQAVAHEVATATREGAQQVAATAQRGAERAKAAVNGEKNPPSKPEKSSNP